MREPDARDALWVLILALAAMLVASLLAAAGAPAGAAGALQQAAFLAAPLLYARAARLEPLRASGFARLRPGQVALVLLASAASLWLMFGLSRVQTELLRLSGFGKQAEAEERMILRSLELSPDQFPIRALLLFSLLPPLCEETFFRGLLFRGVRSRFGPGVSLAATSILFSAVHQTLVQKGMMLFLGCYFGLLVHLTGSLWASILAHAVNNFAVIVMTWKFGTALKDMPLPWWMLALSAIVFGLATAGLVLDRRAPRDAG